MRLKILGLGLVVFSLLTGAETLAASTVSTLEDQTKVEVTVYNNNLALIKDQREIRLPKGEGELRFMDVAAFIMPETVRARCLNAPDKFMVLEQNYEYDLMDYGKLLDKFVGKKVKLLQENMYQDTTKVVEAVLLSNNNNQPVFQIDKEIYLGHGGLKILPEVPDNLIAKPTLMWQTAYEDSAPADLEVSYLTRNIGWKADYVLSLDAKDQAGGLSGWVTVDNKSGTTYQDATLKLVAGEVNQVSNQPEMMLGADVMYEAKAMRAPQFEEQGFFEYHIYDLQRPTILKDKQTKQINFLEADGITLKKEYTVYGIKTYYSRQYMEELPKQPVQVKISFKNTAENHLGMPLPKGVIRLYKADPKGQLQFVGEDRIEHTPKDEELSLKVGEAFDIVAERKQTDFKQLSSRLHESEWEVMLKNHKEENIVVTVIEPLYGNWWVIESSHPHQKIGAFTLRFDIPVKKDEAVKLKYRVRVGLQ